MDNIFAVGSGACTTCAVALGANEAGAGVLGLLVMVVSRLVVPLVRDAIASAAADKRERERAALSEPVVTRDVWEWYQGADGKRRRRRAKSVSA